MAKEHLENLNNAGGVPSLTQAILNKVIIPVPPLDVQNEIVRMLDCFTLLTAELTAELTARKKQYEYYRDALLTPPFSSTGSLTEARLQSEVEGTYSTEVVYKKLGEIATITRGGNFQKKDFVENGLPCIHYGQIHTYYGTVATETKSFCSEELAKKLRKAKPGDLLIATTSEDVEACCKATVWLGEGEVAYSGDSFKFSHNQNPKYIAYLFKTEAFSKQKRLCATGAKVVRVSGAAMEKFKFSFPSLEKQQEIVDKLDTFEALISNIKQEIELRQKQYEYYREKLLTFE